MNKAHILQEIRRTAKENGGAPLGSKTFFKETGIKKGDWHGKHWVRWNDAVREAGFTPNQKDEAYDDELLVTKLVALTKELGQFPVHGDFLMKRSGDTSFPHYTSFLTRFRSKNKMIHEVVEYCRAHPGLEDILRLCEKAAIPEKLPSDKDEKDAEEIGFVYLLKSGRNYKIGRSNAAGRRGYELAIQLPDEANIVHQISTDDAVGIEAYWHSRFALKRKNGEWFDLNAADIAAFKRRKFM